MFTSNIGVLIPSYRRPRVLRATIRSWLRGLGVRYVVVVADSPYDREVEECEALFKDLERGFSGRVVYELGRGRRGSVRARNALLKLASELGVDYALMSDDYVLPDPRFPLIMSRHMEKNPMLGCVGGRVVMLRKRVIDPDFFVNLPIPAADALTRVLGYIFLDVVNGPRYVEFLPHFYMIRGEILNRVRYDESFDTPTAFREESDVHQQVKSLGYKLLLDPHVYVLHIGVEYGGDRAENDEAARIYWKAHNHTMFIYKHVKSIAKRVWYMLTATTLLTLYRPQHSTKVFKGVIDGYRRACITYNIGGLKK